MSKGDYMSWNWISNFKGVDIQHDAGLSLALALWSRSAVLLDLHRPNDALNDMQCAIDNGLDELKKQVEYYVRLAKANASECNITIRLSSLCKDFSHLKAFHSLQPFSEYSQCWEIKAKQRFA